MRKLLTLRWLGITVLAILLILACIGLGRWQLGRGLSATGGLQNLGYAGQWWFFAGVVVYGWVRLARDEVGGRERGPSAGEQMRARVALAQQARHASWVELPGTDQADGPVPADGRMSTDGPMPADGRMPADGPMPADRIAAPAPGRPLTAYVPVPSAAEQADDDPELAAYNDYLARLHRDH